MKKFVTFILAVHASLFTLHEVNAQIINIPADYPTIQEGIAAASNGDTVLVADGLYYENIDFLGKKPLMVASHFLIDGDTNHINNTIIDGSQPDDPNWGSVVIMWNEEDTTSVLCGFTITGGTGTLVPEFNNNRFGAGVFVQYGGKVMYNHIEYNNITNGNWAAGGGVAVLGPASVPLTCILIGNRIAHNTVQSDNDEGTGGGVACLWNLIMNNNEIIFNEASGSWRGDGGGVFIHGDWGHIDLEIRNNKISHNKASSNSDMTDIVLSGGINIFNDCSGIVSNNDISFNEIEVKEGQYGYGTGVTIERIPTTDFIFENNFVTKNTFTGTNCMGGGALIYNGLCRFQNNVIRDNKGTHGGGLAVASNGGKQAVIINNTITGNSGKLGGGFYAASADAVLINTIIWGNTADSSGASIFEDNCTVPVRFSDVQGEHYWPGEGNENVDPGFDSSGYHLNDTSLLWTEGIAAIVINGITYECPEYDIDGDPRLDGRDPDIGADELPVDVDVEESPVVSHQSAVKTYPNPTEGSVDFRFSIFDFRRVSLKMYNAQGQEVATVLDELLTKGEHTVRWDATNLPAGIYYYRLTTNDIRLTTESGKIVKY